MSRNTDLQLMARLVRLPAALRSRMITGFGPEMPDAPEGRPGMPADPRVLPNAPDLPFRPGNDLPGRTLPHGFGRHGRPDLPPFHAGHGSERQGQPFGSRGRTPISRERILRLLQENTGGLRQKAIAEQLQINPSSASEFIDRLADDGYVRREVDPSDRRATIIRLTELGQARASELEDEESERMNRLFGHLTEQEKLDLIRLIDKLLGEPNRIRPDNLRKV